MPTKKLCRKPYIVVLAVHWAIRGLRLIHDVPEFIRFLIQS